MVVKRKVTGKAVSMPMGLGIGLAVSMALTIGIAAVCANLILNERIGEEAIGYCAMVALLLSSGAGGWLAAALVKRRWMIVCVSAGGVYFLSLMAITALFFGGQYQGVMPTALMVFGGSGCVGLLGLRSGKKGGKRLKKYRIR